MDVRSDGAERQPFGKRLCTGYLEPGYWHLGNLLIGNDVMDVIFV